MKSSNPTLQSYMEGKIKEKLEKHRQTEINLEKQIGVLSETKRKRRRCPLINTFKCDDKNNKSFLETRFRFLN